LNSQDYFSRRASSRAALTFLLAFFSVAAFSRPAMAQGSGGQSEVFAGSVFESYLRYLQTVGKSAPTTWGIRGFSPSEIDALLPSDTLHPWASRYNFQKKTRTSNAPTFEMVSPSVGFTFNTAFPWGSNDGPIWAGKGLTSWAQAGFSMRWGPLSARIAPIAFRAENAAFDLWENGQLGYLKYNDAQYPLSIDHPQRFGDSPYSRVDPGESEIRVDGLGLTAGVSTASQWWGPTTVFPYVLGNNAGGFPHLFIGTAKPANVGIGHIHGRIVYGTLSQSQYSPVRGADYFQSYDSPGKERFMAGLTGLIQIRGIEGLEIGGSRFFHSAIDSSGITAADFKLPIQNFLKNRLVSEGDTLFGDDRSLLQNQLASVYFRWAPPGTGVDIYGEFGREDFSADIRDFYLQPDHSSTQNFGFRKAWLRNQQMSAVRAEFFTYEAPAGTRTRGEGLIYLHQPLFQGHTSRGQVLGAPVSPGSGSAQMFAYDRFSPTGRITGFISRVTAGEVSAANKDYVSGPAIKNSADVQLTFGGEMTRFVGPFDITGRAAWTKELNRYLTKGDANNLNFALSVRQAF
jgi:hypothetical protein